LHLASNVYHSKKRYNNIIHLKIRRLFTRSSGVDKDEEK
jgi:hypothetical protein